MYRACHAGTQHALFDSTNMDADRLYDRTTSLNDAENRLALGSGALLPLVGASRRSVVGALLAASSTPLLYRGITGHWPAVANGFAQPDNIKTALSGARGVHVRESIRLEVPLAEAYGFWRRLENLPRFMTHLDRVTESSDGRSHWVAVGPAGLAVEWDAEIIMKPGVATPHHTARRLLGSTDPYMAKSARPAKTAKNKSTVRNSRTTVSGPAEPDASGAGDIVVEKAAGTQDVASAFLFNPNKAAEYDPETALARPEGASVKPADPIVGSSTVTELNGSDKVASGGSNIGQNPTNRSAARVMDGAAAHIITRRERHG